MGVVNKVRILYVDDERSNLVGFMANFRVDYQVSIAESAAQAIELLEKQEFEIIITDQRMPETTGVEFLEQIMHTHPHPIRILLTGYTDMHTVVEAINKGKIFQYVTKPYDEVQMREILEKAFEEYEKRQKLIRDNEKLEFLLRQKLL